MHSVCSPVFHGLQSSDLIMVIEFLNLYQTREGKADHSQQVAHCKQKLQSLNPIWKIFPVLVPIIHSQVSGMK